MTKNTAIDLMNGPISVGASWEFGITLVDGEVTYAQAYGPRWVGPELPAPAIPPVVEVTLPESPYGSGDVVLFRYTPNAEGRHIAKVMVTRSDAFVEVFNFAMTAQHPYGELPSLTEVKAYLGAEQQYSDTEIYTALLAETAAQESLCGPRARYPHDLAEALLRRVAHNLYARSVPSGVMPSIYEGVSGMRLGTDPEIRRLESPYRKRVVA